MRRYLRITSVISLLLAVSLIMTACGGTTATDTPVPAAATATTAPAAAATNTPAAVAAATNTTAAVAAATPTAAPTNTPVPPQEINASVCGSTANGFDASKVKKADVEAGATLRVSGWGNTSEQKVSRDMLCRFAQVYPNVKVTYEPIPDDYQTKIKTQISGGTEADVFYVDPQLTDLLIDSNKLLELTPMMTAAGVNKGDYFTSLINIFSRGDKVYGLPKDLGSIIVFYNTDMVAKTGAKAPPADGKWTWDDYKAFAKTLTQGTDPNTKVFGIAHPADYARWLPFALANGAKVLSDDGKKAAINSPEAKAALDWYYGFIKDGTATEPKTVSAGWPGEAFGKGRIAAAIEGGWMIPYLADPGNGFTGIKYNGAPLPMAANGKQGDLLFTNAYSARADTKYPKAAAALIMFLAGPDNQDAVMRTGFALPTLSSFKDSDYLKTNQTAAALYNAASYGVADYYGKADADIKKAMGDALSALFLGKTDTAGALKTMEDGINAAIANQ